MDAELATTLPAASSPDAGWGVVVPIGRTVDAQRFGREAADAWAVCDLDVSAHHVAARVRAFALEEGRSVRFARIAERAAYETALGLGFD